MPPRQPSRCRWYNPMAHKEGCGDNQPPEFAMTAWGHAKATRRELGVRGHFRHPRASSLENTRSGTSEPKPSLVPLKCSRARRAVSGLAVVFRSESESRRTNPHRLSFASQRLVCIASSTTTRGSTSSGSAVGRLLVYPAQRLGGGWQWGQRMAVRSPMRRDVSGVLQRGHGFPTARCVKR